MAMAAIVRSRFADAALRSALRSWFPFAAFAWIHLALLTLLFHRPEIYKPWYFVVAPWLAVVAGATLVEWTERALVPRLESALKATVPILAAFLVATIVLNLGQWRAGQRESPRYAPLLEEAAWIRDNLPPSALAASWNAGMVGYFSDRGVVNLDGLVNSWQYFRQQRFDLCRYWEETGIRYLVDMFPLDGELEYIRDWYAPQSDLRSYSGRLDTVWKGSTIDDAWAPRAIRIGTGP